MSNDYEPLRITATLRSGVIADRWLPLDGILLYYTCREQFGFPLLSLPGGDEGFELPRLPLAVMHDGEPHWYYACSWARPQPWWVAEGKDYWNKRADVYLAYLVDFRGRRGVIEIDGGRFKAYHVPLFYYAAQRVEWYCVGDRTRIEALLQHATHIGKKIVQGWGRVDRWRVELWSEDWSRYGPEGLMRGVPWAPGEHIPTPPPNLVNYAVRPPGYMRQNQMMLMVPR